MYEPMKYITIEQKDHYESLIASDNPNVDELKHAIGFLLKQVDVAGDKAYNPAFGNNRLCTCGHPYYRHFDGYEGKYPIGCKYCLCRTYIDSGKMDVWLDGVKTIVDYKP